MTDTSFRVDYDRDSDVLYITTAKNVPALAKEGQPGVVWRYAITTGDLVGVTVVDFDAFWRERLEQLIDQMASRFHVSRADAATALEGVN